MRRLIGLVAASALLAATACTGSRDDDGGGDPEALDQVTVGVIPILDVAPIYLGDEQGFFRERGIDLELATADGGAAIVPGVVSGQFQFGFSNVVSLLQATSRDVPLKIVVNGVASTGVDGADFGSTMVKGDSPIRTPADLVGRKVAVNSLRNIADTAVRASMRKAGVADPRDVNMVQMPFPDMPAALANGQVDAAFLVEPFQSAARAQGARSIAASYVDTAPNLTVAAYFTVRKLIDEDPDLVRRFTEAMRESLAYADANPDEARRIIGTYTQIPPEVVAEVTLPTWPPELNRASVETLADLCVQDGVFTERPDLDALLP